MRTAGEADDERRRDRRLREEDAPVGRRPCSSSPARASAGGWPSSATIASSTVPPLQRAERAAGRILLRRPSARTARCRPETSRLSTHPPADSSAAAATAHVWRVALRRYAGSRPHAAGREARRSRPAPGSGPRQAGAAAVAHRPDAVGRDDRRRSGAMAAASRRHRRRRASSRGRWRREGQPPRCRR